MEVLLDREVIESRVRELAGEIERDHPGDEEVHLVCVLKGAFVFLSDLVRAIRESTQQSANQAGQRIVQKDLNIQPTITVRPGWPLRVIVHKDLVLRPYQR